MCLRIYRIVLFMCSDELDKQDALVEQDRADKPVFVAANVEDDSSPLENARGSILGFNVLRCLPGCPLRFMVPGLELLLTILVVLPEAPECAPRYHPHVWLRIYRSQIFVKLIFPISGTFLVCDMTADGPSAT